MSSTTNDELRQLLNKVRHARTASEQRRAFSRLITTQLNFNGRLISLCEYVRELKPFCGNPNPTSQRNLFTSFVLTQLYEKARREEIAKPLDALLHIMRDPALVQDAAARYRLQGRGTAAPPSILGALPRKTARVVRMRLTGSTFKHIASTLHMSERAAWRRFRRASTKLATRAHDIVMKAGRSPMIHVPSSPESLRFVDERQAFSVKRHNQRLRNGLIFVSHGGRSYPEFTRPMLLANPQLRASIAERLEAERDQYVLRVAHALWTRAVGFGLCIDEVNRIVDINRLLTYSAPIVHQFLEQPAICPAVNQWFGEGATARMVPYYEGPAAGFKQSLCRGLHRHFEHGERLVVLEPHTMDARPGRPSVSLIHQLLGYRERLNDPRRWHIPPLLFDERIGHRTCPIAKIDRIVAAIAPVVGADQIALNAPYEGPEGWLGWRARRFSFLWMLRREFERYLASSTDSQSIVPSLRGYELFWDIVMHTNGGNPVHLRAQQALISEQPLPDELGHEKETLKLIYQAVKDFYLDRKVSLVDRFLHRGPTFLAFELRKDVASDSGQVDEIIDRLWRALDSTEEDEDDPEDNDE